MNRRIKSILAFWLCMAVFLQAGFGAWAAETEDAVSYEKTQDEDSGQEDDQSGQEEDSGAGDEKEPEDSDAQKDDTKAQDAMDSEEDDELLEYVKEAQKELENLAGEETLMALVYLCDSYDVKATADFEGETVAGIPSGSMVLIKGIDVDEDFNLWYQISFEKGGTAYKGFILREYLAYSNERFLEWENTYFPQMAMFAASDGYPDIEQFPASYQDKLIRLKQAHPNWTFVRQNTCLDWSKVVSAQCYKDRSLIHSSMGEAYRREPHSPGWYYASEQAVKYYLDPRNFLDETRIFQFEQLTYNPSYHSKAAVQNILKGTFMKGEVPGAGMTYADAFFQIGVSLKVSPFHLACRVYQEQGEGKSPLISGNYTEVPEYKGYYNYYNIGASGTTKKQVIESGLARAVKEGWNSHYASLKGGAGIIAKNYILRGQDTLYLQKFDVDNSDGTLYTHQYMQNISAPYTESSMVKRAYVETGSLNNSFVFKIPVYNDMPSSVCPAPSQSTATATPAATATPTMKPTATPTATPTMKPTATPTAAPTMKPTATPTAAPTVKPTATPTVTPTVKPTATPTVTPTLKPTATPTAATAIKPTVTPTLKPVSTPASTEKPAATPTVKPSKAPTAAPAATSGKLPTAKPISTPSVNPTASPTDTPTLEPTARPVTQPTEKPTAKPTATPTAIATAKPTAAPTAKPSAASEPTTSVNPTSQPAAHPTEKPAAKPTEAPTFIPTAMPATMPTSAPSTNTPEDRPVAPVATSRPAQNENDNASGGGDSGQNNDQNSQEQESGGAQQAVQATAAPTGDAENAPDSAEENAPAEAAGNAASSGIRVVASTPKPHTLSEDKEVVVMDMSKAGMLYAQTLEQISEQGMEVVLKVSDEASWTIDGSRINAEEFAEGFRDVDLKVTLGESRIPKDRLEILTGNEQYVEMALSHDGEFGFVMQLSVKLEDSEPGQYANLFYYNEESDSFEFMCASEISSTKEAAFEFTHASDYVIIISSDTKENLLAEKAGEFEQEKMQEMEVMAVAKEETPAKEPAKAAGIIALILLGSAATGIAVYLIVKRKDDGRR